MGEFDKLAAPVMHGQDKPSWGTPDPAPRLGPLPKHIDLGDVQVGTERTFLVVAPFAMQRKHSAGKLETAIVPRDRNASDPSPFRDKLGLDPDPVLDAETAESFKLASPATSPLSDLGSPPPIRVRFKPKRDGAHEVIINVSAVGSQGEIDGKQILVTARGYGGATQITNKLQAPDGNKALEGTVSPEPVPLVEANTFSEAVKKAETAAAELANRQYDGVAAAADNIGSFEKAKAQPSMLDHIIDIAFMMGVSGIAGVVAKYIATQIGPHLASIPKDTYTVHPSHGPVPPPHVKSPGSFTPGSGPNPVFEKLPPVTKTDQIGPFLTDGIKEGFKNISKVTRSELGKSSKRPQSPGETLPEFSSNAKNEFVAQHRRMIRDRGEGYKTVAIELSEMLGAVDPAAGKAAMVTLAQGMNSAASVADQIQARATQLEWVAAVARLKHGSSDVETPDGAQEVTNLDNARRFGPQLMVGKGELPKLDGILDIHVDLPESDTPVELSGFKVTGASLQGVSQEVADSLRDVHLAHAGIPIRLVVSGHPALITRDEIGRVRVNGYLLTKGQGIRWTEAQMHRGAKFLVDRVLSKTLIGWGVKNIATNDATGRGD